VPPEPLRALLCAAVAALGLLLPASAFSTTVMVMSLGNGKAQLLINGSTVREVRQGQTSPEGVTLIDANAAAAQLMIDGKRMSLGLGQATSSQTVLQADSQGQYFTTASINGISVRAQIDTGATNVALNSEDAYRMGINYTQGTPVMGQTANGPVKSYLVTLRSVQVGDIVLSNVPANVLEGGKAQLGHVLIGMSFLRHVEMRRVGDRMELIKGHF
jgi:aspartyl protease family protein